MTKLLKGLNLPAEGWGACGLLKRLKSASGLLKRLKSAYGLLNLPALGWGAEGLRSLISMTKIIFLSYRTTNFNDHKTSLNLSQPP
jgi:hypothetical protein